MRRWSLPLSLCLLTGAVWLLPGCGHDNSAQVPKFIPPPPSEGPSNPRKSPAPPPPPQPTIPAAH